MILALDLGSSAFKAAIFDEAMQRRGAGAQALQYRYGPHGEVELEVEEVTNAFAKAIHQAVTSAGVAPDSLKAIAITSQAQTFAIVDHAGHPKMPFISWQDTRAVEACQTLESTPALADFAVHVSFGECNPCLHLSQLKHLQDTRPGFIQPDDQILHLPTFLVKQCTGRSVIDRNLAAMSGLYSLQLEDWWPPALQACGLEQTQVPALMPVGSVAGVTAPGAARFGLPAGIPLVLAGNDQTAGAYGARLHENHALLVTLGTAQVVYACTEKLSDPGPAIIRGPYPGGLYYRMVADSCGGNIVNWARTVLAGCDTDQALAAAAGKAAPGCRGLEFAADLPGGNGAWENIGLHHTVPDFARSVFEGLAKRMAQMIEQIGMDAAGGDVLVAGGGSSSSVWVGILADALATRLTVTDADPLSGAAFLGQLAR